jgi:hypothetical protein
MRQRLVESCTSEGVSSAMCTCAWNIVREHASNVELNTWSAADWAHAIERAMNACETAL